MKQEKKPMQLTVVPHDRVDVGKLEASSDDREFRQKHEAALRVMLDNLTAMPPMLQAVECLCLASSLIDEAATQLHKIYPSRESAQLFSIAESLATEVGRLAGRR